MWCKAHVLEFTSIKILPIAMYIFVHNVLWGKDSHAWTSETNNTATPLISKFYKQFKSQILRYWKGGYRSFITEKGYGHIYYRDALITQPRQRPSVISFSQEFTDLLMLSHGTNPHSHFPFIWAVSICIVCTQTFSPSAEDMACQVIQTSGQNFLKAFHISSSSIITLSLIPKLTCQTLEKWETWAGKFNRHTYTFNHTNTLNTLIYNYINIYIIMGRLHFTRTRCFWRHATHPQHQRCGRACIS